VRRCSQARPRRRDARGDAVAAAAARFGSGGALLRGDVAVGLLLHRARRVRVSQGQLREGREAPP
jgi:hypothetical protein